jgi:hypothetical protein
MSEIHTPTPETEAYLTDQEREFMQRLLQNPLEFPDAFKRWVGDYFATNVPLIPYGNFLGSKLNIAKSGDYITTTQGPATSAYGNLATVGPSVNGIADGVYLVLWGAVTTGGAHEGFMGLSVNGDTPVDAEAAASADDQTIAHGRLITLKNDNNSTIVCKYKGTQQNWGRRWIVVIRVATGA